LRIQPDHSEVCQLFFFQAEDGIRDRNVTGVQTCALPISVFGAIVDEGRIVRDGNILSGGGVTAGIDFVLALIAELRGPRAAEMVQLGLEYAPEPPFNSGRPDTAPAEVLEAVNARTATSRAQRRVRLDAWAAAHCAGHHA